MTSTRTTTKLLIANLHCASCSTSVTDILSALSPAPLDIIVNSLTHTVTVFHERELSVGAIVWTLAAADYEVDSVTAECSDGEPALIRAGDVFRYQGVQGLEPRARQADALRNAGGIQPGKRHLYYCEQCRKESEQDAYPPEKEGSLETNPDDPLQSHVKSSAVQMESTAQVLSPIGTPPLAANQTGATESKDQDSSSLGKSLPTSLAGTRSYVARLSIGGMTCAVCSSKITETLESLLWAKKVTINQLTNSGIVEFDAAGAGEAEKLASRLVDEVENCGYEGALEQLQEVDTQERKSRPGSDRKVDLVIEGFYCQHCPPKVLEALQAAFPSPRIDIKSPPSLASPIISVSYVPRTPGLTIRDIVDTITALDERFSVRVYHPPTPEERSREIQLKERNHLLSRLIICFTVAIPTFLIGIVWMSLVHRDNSIRSYFEKPILAGGVSRAQWALFFLSTPAFFACDIFHIRAMREVRSLWRPGSPTPLIRRFIRFGSMNLLISLGVSISYIASIATLAIAAVRNDGSQPDTYYDMTVYLGLFLLCGKFLESYTKGKTADAVGLLGKLRPTEAVLVDPATGPEAVSRDGRNIDPKLPPIQRDDANLDYVDNRATSYKRIHADLLELGEIVCVGRGASPPADGTVISGNGLFDESSLTGESRLISKKEGDNVYVGTINQGAAVNIKITNIEGGTMLDQIVKVVRDGQVLRAPIERLVDSLTAFFVPTITFTAVVTWIIWLSLGLSGSLPDDYLSGGSASEGWVLFSLRFAIAVFVVACPCGIALASPTALFVGSGLAAKHGILARGGGEAFQEASRLDCVVFDKTGTLTQGLDPRVTDEHMVVEGLENISLAYAASRALEESSSHPIARAIVAHCAEKNQTKFETLGVEEIAGKGLRGTFRALGNEYEAVVGNERFLEEQEISGIYEYKGILDSWKNAGKSVVLLALRKKSSSCCSKKFCLSALYATADQLRVEAPGVISDLRERGLDVWMISGDNEKTAISVASMVGIPSENVIASVLPTEKADKVRQLQMSAPKQPQSIGKRLFHKRVTTQQRTIVAMVGDGINDAPALSMADVGIAVGSGSDVAIGTAKFILVSSDLRGLLVLSDLSRAVFSRIRLNFFWACIYNVVLIPIAAGVLYSVPGHIRLDPVWAALAMALSSVSVVCSSLLLKTTWWGVGFRPKAVCT